MNMAEVAAVVVDAGFCCIRYNCSNSALVRGLTSVLSSLTTLTLTLTSLSSRSRIPESPESILSFSFDDNDDDFCFDIRILTNELTSKSLLMIMVYDFVVDYYDLF
ncbi:hypothetical protein DERP_005972 [Dermatophagoides pteronyssinus]|uniref:Uncharacterized protein n=1 Tax=Dermatophagoides pteronyssinus TaxID=6956 RepID=A0ABQ8JSU5_DERPT|nr:hypothetical protein DERP_005972 [Dermatophagoides pteronyssinus]